MHSVYSLSFCLASFCRISIWKNRLDRGEHIYFSK
ncbi:unnamed protein product [Larinioides sclopetarius]|uniref:Photosystem II protein I n=1 Tax=Larinioides sclopetarius TaxID=280406 RepID=A0AAV2AFY2_9ARAC